MTHQEGLRWWNLRDAAEVFVGDRVVRSCCDRDRIDDVTTACGPWPLTTHEQIDLQTSVQEVLCELAVRLACPEMCAELEAVLSAAIGMDPGNVAIECEYDANASFERRHPLVRPHGDIDEPLLGD